MNNALPVRCGYSAKELTNAALGDKKRSGEAITLILIEKIGECMPLTLPIDELETQYYIRLSVADRPGVLAATSAVFSRHGTSIFSMMQAGNAYGESVDVIYVTHTTTESSIRAALEEIGQLEEVHEVATVIRVETDGETDEQ